VPTARLSAWNLVERIRFGAGSLAFELSHSPLELFNMANQCIDSAEQFRKALPLPFDHLE
jgi:hypothetical protein